jgi:hypothetical protein
MKWIWYMKHIVPTLTEEQRREYALLKAEIQQEIYEGLRHFEIAGLKMRRVRDARLYIEEHDTFEAFVRAKLGKSRRFADYLISACGVMEDLRSQGIAQLPDSERICRELAKFPKIDRAKILQRAQAIAKRRDPTYLQVRDAATAIVPTKAQRKLWVGQLLQRFRDAKRLLTINADFSDVTEPSMVEVVTLLVDIEKRVREISVQADKRVEHFLKNRIVNKDE